MKLIYAKDKNIGWITLSNPPSNALVHPAFEDLRTLKLFCADPDLLGIIIKGDGRHFCSGADLESLEALKKDPEIFAQALAQGKKLLEAVTFSTIPVVAMIHGSCLGAGLEIALSCHFRIASENAILGFPESSLGLMPGFGGTVLIQEPSMRKTAIDLIVSGRMVTGPEAFLLGIVDRTAPTFDLQEIAQSFLNSMVAKHPPRVIRAIMESIHNARRLSQKEALKREASLFLDLVKQSLGENP
ncbi:MAG: enoyl-CoA hydratase/isomerase family protein [Pseudomonadota bacterium]